MEDGELLTDNEKKDDGEFDIYDDLPPQPAAVANDTTDEMEQVEITENVLEKGETEGQKEIATVNDATSTSLTASSDNKEEQPMESENNVETSQQPSSLNESTVDKEEECQVDNEIEANTGETTLEEDHSQVNVSAEDIEEKASEEEKGTHFSLLDPKHMTVSCYFIILS